jgi:hypothetical protein
MPPKSLPPHLRPGAIVSAFPPDEPGDWTQVETEEGQAWVRQQSQAERMKSELGTGSAAFRIFQAPTDIGEKKALALKKRLLDEKHYTLLLDRTGMVMTPAGNILCVLLKHRLSPELLETVRPIVRKAANQSVAGANRSTAAGTGMKPRKHKDGSQSKMSGVPYLEDLNDEDYARLKPAKHGTWGHNARDMRGGEALPCRLTGYRGDLKELWLMSELAQEVAEAFRHSFVQDRWKAQFAKADQTPPIWLIKTPKGHTPFTTITCNKSWRTAAHIDKGDLKEGFGVMCCLGQFEGCDLVFPRYQTAVRYREGDILLANVHEVHGNTPLLNPDGSVPQSGDAPERLACIFYYEEDMHRCENTVEDEMRAFNKRKPGDPLYRKKRNNSKLHPRSN